MCLGIPMQIIARRGDWALCTSNGEERLIDMMLVGQQPVGTWVLTFLDSAREILTEEQAQQIAEALQAVQLAMQGEANVDHLFADLIDREPQLPEFLQAHTLQ
ncbi:MAG: HypC/HybG/HupF family hydrogenase formation chaperone [Gammaproteobacteria bacterium]